MFSTVILSAVISASSPYHVDRTPAVPTEPQQQETTIPVNATLPRRRERLTRYERRHPNFTQKEKAAFRRLYSKR